MNQFFFWRKKSSCSGINGWCSAENEDMIKLLGKTCEFMMVWAERYYPTHLSSIQWKRQWFKHFCRTYSIVKWSTRARNVFTLNTIRNGYTLFRLKLKQMRIQNSNRHNTNHKWGNCHKCGFSLSLEKKKTFFSELFFEFSWSDEWK